MISLTHQITGSEIGRALTDDAEEAAYMFEELSHAGFLDQQAIGQALGDLDEDSKKRIKDLFTKLAEIMT